MDLNCIQQMAITQKDTLKVSPDGYIRTTFANFTSLPFKHIFTERDQELQDDLLAQAIFADSAGISEWISSTSPSISLGWAWYKHSGLNCLHLAPEPVRSNVMIVDMHGYDVGLVTTSNLILQWLQYCDWQDMVNLALKIPQYLENENVFGRTNAC